MGSEKDTWRPPLGPAYANGGGGGRSSVGSVAMWPKLTALGLELQPEGAESCKPAQFIGKFDQND